MNCKENIFKIMHEIEKNGGIATINVVGALLNQDKEHILDNIKTLVADKKISQKTFDDILAVSGIENVTDKHSAEEPIQHDNSGLDVLLKKMFNMSDVDKIGIESIKKAIAQKKFNHEHLVELCHRNRQLIDYLINNDNYLVFTEKELQHIFTTQDANRIKPSIKRMLPRMKGEDIPYLFFKYGDFDQKLLAELSPGAFNNDFSLIIDACKQNPYYLSDYISKYKIDDVEQSELQKIIPYLDKIDRTLMSYSYRDDDLTVKTKLLCAYKKYDKRFNVGEIADFLARTYDLRGISMRFYRLDRYQKSNIKNPGDWKEKISPQKVKQLVKNLLDLGCPFMNERHSFNGLVFRSSTTVLRQLLYETGYKMDDEDLEYLKKKKPSLYKKWKENDIISKDGTVKTRR